MWVGVPKHKSTPILHKKIDQVSEPRPSGKNGARVLWYILSLFWAELITLNVLIPLLV